VLKKGKMRENHPKFVPSQHPFLVQNKVFQHPARILILYLAQGSSVSSSVSPTKLYSK